MSRNVRRRRVLKGIGLAGVTGLAGCAGDGDGDGDGGTPTATEESEDMGAGDADGDGGGDGGTPTETATEGDGGDGGDGGGGEMPDVLTVIGYPDSGLQLFRDYYNDYDPDDVEILVPDGMQDPDMQSQIGNPMENLTGTAPAAAGPNREAFAELYQDEYGESPGVFTAHTFDAVAILILANAAAGENSGPAIRDQMRNVANGDGMEVSPGNLVEGVEAAANGEQINYQGASSPTDFDENGDPAAAAYDVWEFAPDTDQGFEVLETIDFEGDPGGDMADESPGGTDRTARVGLLLPETGDLSSVGGPMIDAGELAAQVVNDGDAPIDVDLQFEDSQTDAQAGINAANSLINAGYPAIAGPASSGVNVPVSQQSYIPNEVVGCSPSSTALSVTFLEDNDYVFRTAPSDLLQGQVLAQVAAERLDGSTSSTMYVNNDYGQQLSEEYVTNFEDEHDGTVWQNVAFQKEQSSYSAELSNALQSGN